MPLRVDARRMDSPIEGLSIADQIRIIVREIIVRAGFVNSRRVHRRYQLDVVRLKKVVKNINYDNSCDREKCHISLLSHRIALYLFNLYYFIS